MPTEYRLWWDFFQTGCNQHQAYQTWFCEQEDELPNIKSMVSVGAGYGDLDAELIKTTLKGVRSYIGVEPDPDLREMLSMNMAQECPDVQLQVVSAPVPDWQGPSEPVDLVLAIQVFYYFTDPVSVLQEMYNWLRPGGVLIIGHNHDDNMYADVAKKVGLKGLYCMPNLKEDVKLAGLSHYIEYKMEYTVDNADIFNEEMMWYYYYRHYVQNGNNSAADAKKCVDILRKRCERNEPHEIYHNGIIMVEKLP